MMYGKVFCWHEHRVAAEHTLRRLGCGAARPRPIYHERDIYSHDVRDAIVFDVACHASPIPPRIRELLAAQGCVWLTLDDEPSRRVYARDELGPVRRDQRLSRGGSRGPCLWPDCRGQCGRNEACARPQIAIGCGLVDLADDK